MALKHLSLTLSIIKINFFHLNQGIDSFLSIIHSHSNSCDYFQQLTVKCRQMVVVKLVLKGYY